MISHAASLPRVTWPFFMHAVASDAEFVAHLYAIWSLSEGSRCTAACMPSCAWISRTTEAGKRPLGARISWVYAVSEGGPTAAIGVMRSSIHTAKRALNSISNIPLRL